MDVEMGGGGGKGTQEVEMLSLQHPRLPRIVDQHDGSSCLTKGLVEKVRDIHDGCVG